MIVSLPAVQGSLGEIVRYGLPDDYIQRYSARVQKLTIDDLGKAAKKTAHNANFRIPVPADPRC